MKKIFLAIVFCFLAANANSQSGYDITIHLKNTKDTLAYLTFYQFDKTYIKDTCTHIKNGKIIFKGNKKLEKGIYSLVGQEKNIYFDFFIDDETQKLELKTEAGANMVKELTAVNSPRENDFFDYIKFIGKQNENFMEVKKKNPLLTKKDTLHLKDAQKEIETQIHEYEQKFIARQKGTFIGNVVNLKTEKFLKDIPKVSNGRPDSLAVYKYYKNHYWDNVDFKDEGTIKNPFFFNKMKKYLENVVVTHPDSVSVEVDKILDKTKEGSLTYKIMLTHLTYYYETSKLMGFDKVFVHLIDRYFKTGKAIGIYQDDSVIDVVIKRANVIRPLLLGLPAPELSMIKASDSEKLDKMGFSKATNSEEVTKVFYSNYNEVNSLFYKLYSVQADYTVLVFWDVDCGHCQVEIPKLLKVYHELKKENKDIKVFSVYTQQDVVKYLKFIKENELDWINVYDGAHFNNIPERYDVYSTPVMYLLDKNKIIKAKKIGAEQLKDVIKAIELDSKMTK